MPPRQSIAMAAQDSEARDRDALAREHRGTKSPRAAVAVAEYEGLRGVVVPHRSAWTLRKTANLRWPYVSVRSPRRAAAEQRDSRRHDGRARFAVWRRP